eukprot:GHRR01020765.1.p1 GENE.GHRR01020765.1~~GHRR01020765.1.p1  ORF type:complete len:154 (+),score=41.53 GHRR01020765.1:104-565(+)
MVGYPSFQDRLQVALHPVDMFVSCQCRSSCGFIYLQTPNSRCSSTVRLGSSLRNIYTKVDTSTIQVSGQCIALAVKRGGSAAQISSGQAEMLHQQLPGTAGAFKTRPLQQLLLSAHPDPKRTRHHGVRLWAYLQEACCCATFTAVPLQCCYLT